MRQLVEPLWQDVRHAARRFRTHSSFTAIAVLTLALGIGANAAVFSVVDAVLLHPLPFPEPERLVAIHGTSTTATSNPLSYPNFLDLRNRAQTFEAMAAWHLDMFTLTGQSVAERLIGGRVSANYFSTLGARPLIGRLFEPHEDKLGAPPVALLGERLWRRRFAGDPAVVGDSITLDGRPHTVLGVIPANVGAGVIARLYNDVFLPIGQYDDKLFLSRHVNAAAAIGRLRPSVSLTQARAEMETIANRLAVTYPEVNKGVGVNVVPLEEDLVGNLRPSISLLLGAVAFVLLIACANVGNLVLAQFTDRTQEFAVRAALGASRGRIVRQALTEGVCLATAGGAIGAVLAGWSTRAALGLLPSALPDIVSVRMNERVLLVTAIASALTGILCAVVPALRAARADVRDGLQQCGRGAVPRRHRAQSAFVIAQLALTLTLLVGAGLMGRSLSRLWRVDPGFDPRGVVTFMTGLPRERATDPTRIRATFHEIAERLSALPEVEAASVAFGAVPYTGNNNSVDFWRAGEPRPLGGDARGALFSAVGPEYFGAMGIPLLRGRSFVPADDAGSVTVAIVDDALAGSVYPHQNPIGQHIHLDPLSEPVEVVGVVGHVKHWGLDADEKTRVQSQVYIPAAQLPDSLGPLAAKGFTVVIRSAAPTARLLGSLRATLRAYDSGQAMNNERVMGEAIDQSLAGRKFSLIVLGAFAGLALLLSMIGTYGLASYLATQRTQEIGVRMALGAAPADIMRTLLGHGGRLAAIGIVGGVLASLGLGRLVAGMLFDVSPADPVILGGVAMLLLLVTILACYLPARRALRVDPVVALRQN